MGPIGVSGIKEAGDEYGAHVAGIFRGALLLASDGPGVGGRHYHLNHLGTPRLITDDYGRTVGEYEYYAFGTDPDSNTREVSAEESLKFTGHQRDIAAGDLHVLDYMHAGYYDGAVGRFLSVDPVLTEKATLDPQRWNRYTYVGNNPLGYADPNGRERQLPYCIRHRCSAAALREHEQAGNEVWYVGGALGALLVGPEIIPAAFSACLGNLAACTTSSRFS